MNDILGLSFASPSLPIIDLNERVPFDQYRLGLASYPVEDYTSIIIKNVAPRQGNHILDGISIPSMLTTSTFLMQLSNTQPVLKLKNAQPYIRSYAGRDWTFVLTGDINNKFLQYAIINSPFFQPNGNQIAEWLFCWLLQFFYNQNAMSIADINMQSVIDLLKNANAYGNFNLLMSDGQDILAYHDLYNFEPLNWFRSCPPRQENFQLKLPYFNLGLGSFHINRTFIILSNQAIADVPFTSLLPGQSIMVRRSNLIWNSHLEAHVVAIATNQQRFVDKTTNDNYEHHHTPTLKQTYLSRFGKNILIPSVTADKQPFIYTISHHTKYQYQQTVYLSRHMFRMQPIHDLTQALLHYELNVLVNGKITDLKVRNFNGAFGNNATLCEVDQPYNELSITGKSIVAVFESDSLNLDVLRHNQTVPLIWMPWDKVMMQAYLVPPELPENELFELTEYAMSFVKRHNNDVLAVLNDINETIFRDYAYVSGSTTLATTTYEVFVNHRGVCQDFANLFICLARLLNIPARYRTGYIYTGANYENKFQSDATHAWVEVFLPSIGWKGFDPTNCCVVNKDHIRVACGRHYKDATPSSGTIYNGGQGESLMIDVKVNKISDEELNELINLNQI